MEERLNILHLDMDAFYAAVEEMDSPHLKGKALVVGGLSSHGVVTTANYEARKYGVHSAMPAFKARALCPHAYYLKPRMDRYRYISEEIFKILYGFTDLIEKVSVDEAYMDISNIAGEPEDIVREIKLKVRQELGLTMSVGLSYNKFLAKLASDWNKPDGFKKISRDMLPHILHDLSIDKVHGIGRKSSSRLKSIGVYKIRDLLRLDEDFLIDMFGKSGREIYHRIRGVDQRELEIDRERKSIGIERTFDRDTSDLGELDDYLRIFSKQLAVELKEKEFHTRTIIVKIKDDEFKTQTRSRTLNNYIFQEEDIYETASELLGELKIRRKIRLLGITAGNLIGSDLVQLSLFD